MKNIFAFCLLFLLLTSFQPNVEKSQYKSFEQGKFKNPDNTFRAVPFYSLNDDLQAGELTRQLHIFKEAGYGGAFLHSRIGLLTPYLSDHWFDMMKVGTGVLQELGMNAWYYDEDKWPSGFAGGLVPVQSQDYRARSLARVAKGTKISSPDTILLEDDHYMYVELVSPMGNAWFNGTSWVDLMNPQMVQAFIECSYKPYVERYAGKQNAMGIFTDEPQISPKAHISHNGLVAYSPVMLDIFRKRCGYELIPILPSLFDTIGDWRKIRVDYYRTVAFCMENAFSKPIGDYCKKSGFIWTGHYNGEDNPTSNMLNTGNLMQQLRHMQQPGIDALGLRYGSVYLGKIAGSVANQYGIERRLSELFGISGHNMSFEDRMWITSWHTVMGINFMCPHLYLYSMKGARKRDYPPAISHQQPYWAHNKLFEDYSARLCYFATVGKTTPEICVIHPLESAYIEQMQGNSYTRDGKFESLLQTLMKTHRNFDIGDEQIIQETGKVKDGKFVINKMAYSVVVLPEMLTIRKSTIELLSMFRKSGGTVFVCGSYPAYVDGQNNQELITKLKKNSIEIDALALKKKLVENFSPQFYLTGEKNETIWTHLRTVSNGQVLQLSNTSRLDKCQINVRFADKSAPVALWNPINGDCLQLKTEVDGSYKIEFAPAQTWILSTGNSAKKATFTGTYFLPVGSATIITLPNIFKGKRLNPNAITLDFASFSTDGGKTWNNPEPVLAFYDRSARKGYNGPLRFKFEIQIDELPENCSLVLEQPEMYNNIQVNGKDVKYTGTGYYVDATFKTQPIASLLKKGENIIVLSLDYISPVPTALDAIKRYGTEIESIYLIGDFAVTAMVADTPQIDTWKSLQKALPPQAPVNRFKSFALNREKSSFSGDLSTQGYPFYAGGFQLDSEFELDSLERGARYKVVFPKFESILIEVQVNGNNLPVIFSNPWECDITQALKQGKNNIRITLTNGLRNLLGPHHHKGGEFSAVGPATFHGDDAWPNIEAGERDWYDARLRGTPILWRDMYHIIPFGILESPVITEQRPVIH